MKPIGPLMREHRLIERMVGLMEKELQRISQEDRTEIGFIEADVDFFRIYADRTHHGKEEDILFRELAKKPLSREHKQIMDELIEEHAHARKLVTGLSNAKESYVKGGIGSLKDIQACLKELVTLYPAHIEKEDKRFFYPCMEYFSEDEQDKMLQEFWDFDKNMIHEKYEKAVEELERGES